MLGYRERAGLLLLQLFPNGGATDIVFVTLFCIAVGTTIAWCGGRCRTDSALTFCCSGGGPRQPWSSGLAPVSRFHSSVPLFPLVTVPNRPTRLRGHYATQSLSNSHSTVDYFVIIICVSSAQHKLSLYSCACGNSPV